MPRLAIAKEFLSDYAKLDKPVRKSVDDAIAKFEHHTHAGLHLEKLSDARDPNIRTIRIDKFWRGIVLASDVGDVFCLLAVVPHDEAIKYAKSRRFSVNQALQVLETRDEEALEQITPGLENVAKTESERLFGHVSDADLIRLGVDQQVLPIVRMLTSEEHLTGLEAFLPEPQHDALVALASGMTVEEAWVEVSQWLPAEAAPAAPPAPPSAAPSAATEPGDLVAAMERTPSRVRFVSGVDELQDVLRHPFAAWRIFLHPTQREIAYRRSYNGAVQVAGGAGTGKTVTALHRARHLAETSSDDRPILVTTFTTTLAEALGHQLDLLIEDAEVRARIEVVNVDRLARQVFQNRHGHHPKLIGDAERQAFWNIAAGEAGLSYGAAFLDREWTQVVLAQDLKTREDYLSCIRRGQGRQLTTAQREPVWRAISGFTARLKRAGYWTYELIAAEAARLLSSGGVRKPYRHIIVDEAQDLHAAKWRMLRAAVDPGPDDLFIVGDPHQRIYDNRVSLQSLGISVRGRSHRLKLSYRTTQEILAWSMLLLGQQAGTGLGDEPDSLVGLHSTLHGRRPVVRSFTDRSEEMAAVVEQIHQWMADGVEPGAIGVAARTKSLVGEAKRALQSAGISVVPLTGDAGVDAVHVGTMHRMKGLEFRCVAIVGADRDVVPARGAVTSRSEDPLTHEQDLQRERCLFFVACTRARDFLYVSHSGSPSPFLP